MFSFSLLQPSEMPLTKSAPTPLRRGSVWWSDLFDEDSAIVARGEKLLEGIGGGGPLIVLRCCLLCDIHCLSSTSGKLGLRCSSGTEAILLCFLGVLAGLLVLLSPLVYELLLELVRIGTVAGLTSWLMMLVVVSAVLSISSGTINL